MSKDTAVGIPDVLIEFLHEVLDSDASVTTVILVPEKLGWGLVQDIILQSSCGATTRRVYGFNPVNAHLRIERTGNRCDFVPAA